MSATWVEGNQKSVVSSMPSSSSLAYLRILDETFSSDIVFLACKFLLVHFYENEGNMLEEGVYADSANAGIGDTVLVCEDGDAAEMIFDLKGEPSVFDGLIVGVVD